MHQPVDVFDSSPALAGDVIRMPIGTTSNEFALGTDGKSSVPISASPNRGSLELVGVAGCMPGYEGTQPTAAVGV